MSTDTAIPEGSLVLVTGANGFIGSHVADAILAAGYRVRGTARSSSKLNYLQNLWEKKYGVGKFEVAVVEDFSKDGAFDEAIKGVSGIAHVASILTYSAKPAEVVDPTVRGLISILHSAAAQSTVKRFVYTSSSTAGTWPRNNVEFEIGEDSWNEEGIDKAYSLKEDDPHKAWHVYAASKALSERAAWKFMEDEKPNFVFNSILPDTNFGPILDPNSVTSTGAWIPNAYKGDIDFLKIVPPQWFVDVRDTARLHVLALASSALSFPGARVWAVSETFNVNDILQILRKLYPQKNFPADVEGIGKDLSRIDNKRGGELLGGWIGLEDSIKANTSGL